MSPSKKRLDLLLLERFPTLGTRSRVQAMILAGDVLVDQVPVTKPGTPIKLTATLTLRGDQNPYASRGGLKLHAALEAFKFDCTGLHVIDVGASTGGFTDCVLQHGAEHVFCVDVGYGQLAWKLRSDPRVTNFERTNIRHLDLETFGPKRCDLAVIDCSFISLHKVLPGTLKFLTPTAHILSLIKPQFEAGPGGVGKGGVVRDKEVRAEAIAQAIAQAEALGTRFLQGIDCPVAGPAGNVEYLALFVRT